MNKVNKLINRINRTLARKGKKNLGLYIRKGFMCSVSAAIVLVIGAGTLNPDNSLCFGSEAIVNGQRVAIVKDVDKFEATMTHAENFVDAVSDHEADFNVVYLPRVIEKDAVTSDGEILQNLYSQCSGMINGCAIYVDGELIAAAASKDIANEALEKIKAPYAVDGVDSLEISFDNKIELKEEYVPSQMLMSADGIADALIGERNRYCYYTVERGDTLSSIAQKLNVTEDAFAFVNGDALMVGMVIPYRYKDTVVDVKVEYLQTATVVVPYETENIETEELTRGKTQIKTQGSDGEKLVTTKVVMINGEEVGTEIVEEELITPAQNEVVLVGCGLPNCKTVPAAAGLSSGIFTWPIRGIITSGFGPRPRDNHKGLDISAPMGTNIYAADGGKVTFAGWNNGGYGYLVIIDHGNGCVTYYAHCSQVLVEEGAVVKQGDPIALVGSTGISTGPHLHFEIRLNGTPTNPIDYLEQ